MGQNNDKDKKRIRDDSSNPTATVTPSTDRQSPSGSQRLRKNFSIFLIILLIISYMIISPLLYGIAWGAVFAFLWRPVHKFIERKSRLGGHPNICAAVSFTLLMCSITIPLAYTLHAVASELMQAYDSFSSYILHVRDVGLPPLDEFVPEGLRDFIMPIISDRAKIAQAMTSIAQSVASFLQNLSKGLLQWTGSFVFQAFIALMTLFFMIRDGERVVGYIKEFIPLPGESRERFVDNTARIMNSVSYGVILTVMFQAMLGGLGWATAGLPKAFLASAAMFIFGMFPMGTAIVWLPGAIYLMATGSLGWGTALLVWGIVVVSSIDNILRPIFIGSGSSLPTLALIIGLTGGIAAWGLLGVFLGPLTIALFLSVLDMYRTELEAGDDRP